MHSIEELAGQHFDAVIVGGGINGAGLARDLALRSSISGFQLRILLLEKSFWGHGTSGRNSHLIHGGLRYLKHFDFRLVREALEERGRLLRLCPHTVRPLRFELTCESLFDKLFYGAGIALYDILAGYHRIGASSYFGQRLSYWDAASDSAALVIDNVREASHYGATCLWGRPVKRLWSEGIELTNGIRVKASCVIDARGPWIESPALRLVRGSHIVLPRLYPENYATAHFHSDGRIIFFIPWGDLNPVTLIGTTDVDHGASADQVAISSGEIDYLRAITARLFPHAANFPLLGSFSSLRPLISTPGKSASSTSREHSIAFNANGVLEIQGGKYTTYRAMAEEAANQVVAKIAPGAGLDRLFPTRDQPFVVLTERPRDLAARLDFARREEGCSTLEHFMTCSTNWAWQKRWTADELRPIAAAFGGSGIDEFLSRYSPCS
jgi:glycerol-3-phosphate dehydrogenase